MRMVWTAFIVLAGLPCFAAGIPSEMTWNLGKHDGNSITLKTEGKRARLTSTRVNRPDSSRVIDAKIQQKIISDWAKIGLKPMTELMLVNCADLLVVSQTMDGKKQTEHYCSDQILRSQALDFKNFYTKLLAVSINPKKKY